MNLKKVITAINNPILNDKLLNCKNIEVLKNDIQYKEGILEILELEKNIRYFNLIWKFAWRNKFNRAIIKN